MERDWESAVPLDGNAAGGLLAELFALDVTVATLTCEVCSAIAPVAEVKVYDCPMGAIFRCGFSGAAVLRLARTPATYWLDMRGMQCLRVRPTPS